MKKTLYIFAICFASLAMTACGGGAGSESEMAAHLKKFAAGEACLYPNGVYGEIIEPFRGNDYPYSTVIAVPEGEFSLLLHSSFNSDIRRGESYKGYILHAIPLDEAGSADEFVFFTKKAYNRAINAYNSTPRVARGASSHKPKKDQIAFSSKVIATLRKGSIYADNTALCVFFESGDVIMVNSYRKFKYWDDMIGKTIDVLVWKKSMGTYGEDILLVE